MEALFIHAERTSVKPSLSESSVSAPSSPGIVSGAFSFRGASRKGREDAAEGAAGGAEAAPLASRAVPAGLWALGRELAKRTLGSGRLGAWVLAIQEERVFSKPCKSREGSGVQSLGSKGLGRLRMAMGSAGDGVIKERVMRWTKHEGRTASQGDGRGAKRDGAKGGMERVGGRGEKPTGSATPSSLEESPPVSAAAASWHVGPGKLLAAVGGDVLSVLFSCPFVAPLAS